MNTRRLGRTNLQVSTIGFGGARLDEQPEHATETVHRALENSVNFIDTARYYGNSEKFLGIALKGHRDEVILATKSLIATPDISRQSLETSLSLLQLDGVDLLYAHACDNEDRYDDLTRKNGMLKTLESIREEGITRFLGVSFNHFLPFERDRTGVDRMKTLIMTDAFDVIQVPMSLIRIERIEEEVLPLAAEYDMGVVVNFPTANGLLTTDIGAFWNVFSPHVQTPCQGALLGPLLQPAVTSVLSGMSTPEMADENCAVGTILADLSAADLNRLWEEIVSLGIGSCRSCGRCGPFTGGVPVAQILTYWDAYKRFGIEGARAQFEAYRQQALSASSFKGADAVCPAEMNVLEEVQRVFEG
jgi:uncharacterized protein